jgi:hypothetical protein
MSSVALLSAQNRITTPIFTRKVIARVIGSVIARALFTRLAADAIDLSEA